MKTRLLTIVTFWSLLGGGAPAFAELEDFSNPEISKSWNWIREDAGAWRIRKGALELRAQKGRVWSGNDARNLLVFQRPAGGASAEVDVQHDAPKTKYEQGGLLVYRDADHFVKLIVEFIDGEYYIVLAREIAGAGKVFSKVKIPAKSARLRLTVKGNKVSSAFQLDAKGEWKNAGECELPEAVAAKFALFTQDGSAEEVRWIRFDNFKFAGLNATSSRGAFDTLQLSDKFHAEGATLGDLNRDGVQDIIYGPFWFAGPDFKKRHLIYKPNPFEIGTYSNNFMPYAEDLDGDGWQDVLVLGFPGRKDSTYWWKNPGSEGGAWTKHIVFDGPGNESPAWTDVDGDGKNEIVCSVNGQFGLVKPDWSKPEERWTFLPISAPGSTGGHFTHGMGIGDVDGDGLADLLEKTGWWKQRKGKLWKKHAYPFAGAGGAQMFAYDFDGDGDRDVITSLAAHSYGLAWFEQVADDKGEITFHRHLIMGSRAGDSEYGLVFSQPHAVDLIDVDGDGVKDLITGKRYFAHGGKDPGGQDNPVIYWFRTLRGGGPGEVDFVPHLIDSDSGVGTVVNTGDANGDGRPDIIIGNKKGCYLHLQTAGKAKPMTRVGRVVGPEVEGETLQVLRKTGNTRPQSMANFKDGHWSGNAQLWWAGGKPGDVLELAVPVAEDGFYLVSGAMTKAADYGIFEMRLGGQVLGDPVDFFQPEGVSHTGTIQLGGVELKKGQAIFSVKILGAHADAVKGYMFGLDYLLLKKVEKKPQPLFDGKSLQGWEGDRKWWRVEGGTIVGEIAGGGSLSSNQFLFWDGEVHDFELRLKYRIGGHKSANSGVQFRAQATKGGSAAGYQADIDDGAVWTGRIYDEHGRGLILERGTKVAIDRAGGRKVEPFRESGDYAGLVKKNDWNEYVVRAVGPHIVTTINGHRCADLTDNQIGQHDFSGKLALQLHSGPGPAKVEFKDIVLTPLGRTQLPKSVSAVAGQEREGIVPPGTNLGFEDGSLKGWKATGDAWNDSPIEGDTVSPRRPGQASGHDGKFWVGGYERTHNDEGQGTLTSDPFEVTHSWGSFLVGGGPGKETRVELILDEGGAVLFTASGRQLEDMAPVYVDLSKHMGKNIRIRVVDESSGPWGHINYDDFRFHPTKPMKRPGRLASNRLLKHLIPNPTDEGADPTVAGMWVPAGFQVDLIAREPDVTQPIAFTFDERGRMWVAEAHSYPRRQPEGKGRDRVVIFEDADGNGSFEKKTVFASGLNLVSGIEVGFGGVWIGAAPQLLFIPDRNHDDKPDGKPVVLLDGWGLQDTHETLNSFTWGPDGWLYGNQGVFNHSIIGKPGSLPAERVHMRAGVWRYHPEKHEFEIFATGCSNQWGIDFDEYGHLFITHCRSAWGGGPTTYVVKGGHYWNQSNSNHAAFVSGGQAGWNPGNGKVFRNFLPSSAGYGHGEGGAGKPGSRALYGGHSHVGTMIYLGGNWPEDYRNQLFTHNLHGHQMNRQVNRRKGSGFETLHAGTDQLYTPDPRFIGVDLKYGPDGAVYMIDWYDKQHCHTNNVDAWDRSDGRIYRMAWAKTYQPVKVDLSRKSTLELVKLVTSKDEWYSRMARRVLHERNREAGRAELARALSPLLGFLEDESSEAALALRALWALQLTGHESAAKLAIQHRDENVRAWAVRLLAEETVSAEMFIALARSESSSMVRLALASALPAMKDENARWALAEVLAARSEDRDDVYLPKMIWFGIAPLAHGDPVRSLTLAETTTMPMLADSIVWYLSRHADGRAEVSKKLATTEATRAGRMLDLMAFSLPASGKYPAPPGWAALSAKLRNADTAPALDKLGGLFGDASVLAAMRRDVVDRSLSLKKRKKAFDFLKASGDADCAKQMVALLEEAAFRPLVLPLLGRFNDEGVASALLNKLPVLEGGERNAALGALSSKPKLARALLRAIKEKRADKSLLTSLHIRLMRSFGDAEVDKKITEVWGRVQESSKSARESIASYKKLFSEAPLWSYEEKAGAVVFNKLCATCHVMNGKGIALGPDLTGSHASGLDYFIENIVDPNAVVGENFQLNIVTKKDGAVVSGMPSNETGEILTIRTLTESVDVRKAEIKSRQILPQSMMPPALLESLPDKEVIELLKFLTSK